MTTPQRPTDAEQDPNTPGTAADATSDEFAMEVDDAAVMALLKGLDDEGDIPAGPSFLSEEMPDSSMTPAQMAALAAAAQPRNDDAAMLAGSAPRAARRPRPSRLTAEEANASEQASVTPAPMAVAEQVSDDECVAPLDEDEVVAEAFEAPAAQPEPLDDFAAPADFDEPVAPAPTYQDEQVYQEDEQVYAEAVDALEPEPMGSPAASMSMDMFEEEKPPEPVAPTYDANVKRFMFERDFEAELRPPPPPPEPIPEQLTEVVQPDAPIHPPSPMFSAEELHAARMAAYADGETTGLQTAMASIDQKVARALEMIGGQLPSLQHDREQVIHSISEEAARLAHAMVARMFPEMARRYGLTEIEAVIASSIEQAIDQPRIIIRLHPDLAPMISEKAEHMATMAGYAGRLSILPEATLGPSDVRIEWGDGGAERLVSRAWADISDIVGRAVTHLAETVPSDQDNGLSAA
ncbi:hypothetical protein ACFSM5_10265 [Lacibacterium aquatile]|uniref:Flagellar assembly protein FliH/Type III secretion system HrpE domain-containing protein n=1 Tax=Lacibacterium aquatile TaxID=1168082 RepID=A0ABW5DQ69_9PROT